MRYTTRTCLHSINIIAYFDSFAKMIKTIQLPVYLHFKRTKLYDCFFILMYKFQHNFPPNSILSSSNTFKKQFFVKMK